LRAIHLPLTGSSIGGRPSRYRFLRPVAAAALIGVFGASVVLASTPVTNGYKDQAYGGGSFRPTSEKPQSKLWYTNGSWFAGMFLFRTTPLPAKSEFHIFRLDQATHAWLDTGTLIDPRDQTHGDYLWDEGSQTLWVASASRPDPAIDDDATKVFKYSFNAATGIYTLAPGGYPKVIPGTVSLGAFQGGAIAVTLARDSAGTLWATWGKNGDVLYSRSTDQGFTWSNPVKVPVQTNSIRPSDADGDLAAVIAFGTKVGIMWSDHDALPSPSNDGFYFAVIATGADPAVAGNWSLEELPTLVSGADPREVADDHLSIKATSDGTVYAVGKTGKDTASCATNKQLPLVEAFRRTTAGVWSAHLVSTVGDCSTRPQLILDEQLGVAYVAMTSPNGGGAIYLKSAPLSGPDALVFRGAADQTIQRGTPFIRSATETAIDDATTMKQNVTSATGIVVLANNITTPKFYLHNEMSIAAADSAAPTGSATINDGAAFSATNAVTVSVPATDAGSGVSLVRLSNSPALTGDVLTTGTSYSYDSPIAWTLSAGEGARTVYAQWRDAAGNWSGVTNDTIVVDATEPTGTIDINGGAAATNTANVTLSLTTSDGGGSGTASVLVSNSTDFSGASPIAYAASVPWTLAAGDGTKTVYLKFVDALGHASASPISDTITLDTGAPTPGTVTIDGGATVVHTTSVTVALGGVAGDATAARAANSADMAGAIAVSPSGSFAWTLAAGSDGPRTVYVQWADTLGNWSAAASDDIILDASAPAGTVAINAGNAWTKSTAVSLTFPNTDGDVVQVRVGTDPTLAGVAYQGYAPGMTLPFTVPAGNGQKTVYAQFKDIGGLESPIVSDSIGLDTTAPTAARAPVHKLSNPVTTRINVHLAWSGGADTGGSGLAGYVLRQRINGGAWTIVSNPTVPAANVGVLTARSYQFQVAARDAAGNVGPFASGRVLRAANYSESSRAIRYSGTWPRQSLTTYFGGVAKYARARSASATLTFTGNQVAWLSRRGPTSGRARVYLDGRLVTTINLYSSTTKIKQVVFTRKFATVRTHKLKIVVVGTAGHPRVTVDGFFVLR
jgi:hypothetical protein